MIYPAFQKAEIREWIAFSPSKAEFSGFDSDYAAQMFDKAKVCNCKGNSLYISFVCENTYRTEYIAESRRLSSEKYFIDCEKCADGLKITATVSCRKSLFRAVNRIIAMSRDESFPIGSIEDYPLFAKRGYIEGFYGNPWSHKNRKMMLELMSFYGMNTYYYAPKDDPYHRDKWDELYPEKELAQLSELADFCKEYFVDFYFCIAPGLSMKYSEDADFEKLACKAHQLYNAGIRNFGLLLDDIPENLYYDSDKAAFGSEAVNAHIYLANRFCDYLQQIDPNCRLTVCPLQYHGRGDEYYISKLGQGLSGKIDIFWTGNNICSQELTVREAVIFENATNHKPIYWDNFPVNDAEMYNEMHLGYISGREPELYRYSEGVVSNTMESCLSSRIPLLTVCDYLWNPVVYDEIKSWHNACDIILEEHKETLMPFFDNLLTSCLKVENSPMMNSALADAQQKMFAGDVTGAEKTMQDYIASLKKCCEALKTLDNPMISELMPWAEKQFIALDLLESAVLIFKDNSPQIKSKTQKLLNEYLAHPKTLCDFSLQSFAERMLLL